MQSWRRRDADSHLLRALPIALFALIVRWYYPMFVSLASDVLASDVLASLQIGLERVVTRRICDAIHTVCVRPVTEIKGVPG